MSNKPLQQRFWTYIVVGLLLFFLGMQYDIWRRSSSAQPKTEPVEDSLARIVKSGVLRVGYIDYPPAVIKDPNTGQLSGEFVDIAKFIASQLNVRLEFEEASWSTFMTGLQTHNYDISIAPTYIQVSRSANVAFTRPIAFLGNSAGVKKGDSRFENIQAPTDLDRSGLVVAVVQGEAADLFVKEHFKSAKVLELSGSDLSAPLELVATGQADVGLTDAYVTEQFVAQKPSVRDLFPNNPYNVSPMSWAVRPDDYRLLNFLNNSLEYLEATGKTAEWQKKYHAPWMYGIPSVKRP
jgi:polar amino acid transport system substrate-binding protein